MGKTKADLEAEIRELEDENQELQDQLDAVADASLVSAERLLAEGKRDQALAFYTALSAPDIPKPVRLAAMHGIIREETSISRPR